MKKNKNPNKSRIYVASSWKNPFQQQVVARLLEAGHEVYDFRNPPHGRGGFSWSLVSDKWQQWNCSEFIDGMDSDAANEGFKADKDALEWADVCVLVLPCGRSAHTEAGWMSGAGKKVIVYIPEYQEPELMYKLFDLVTDDLDLILTFLEKYIRADKLDVARNLVLRYSYFK